MTNNYFLRIFAILTLGLFISCDNTTDDPPNQNKNTSSSSSSSSGGNSITGPRILEKVNMGNTTVEEYSSTSGVLYQAVIRDNSSSDAITATLTYNNNKVAKIKYTDNKPTHIIDHTYLITYTNGKITSMTLDNPTFNINNHSDFSIFYDSNGQLYRIVEKKKMGGSSVYTHYIEDKFTFASTNVAKVEHTTMLMDNNAPDTTTASTIVYAYDSYDSKINPYTTLPKEYLMVTGVLMAQVNFYMLSSNNVGNITIQSPIGPAIPVPKTYLYDAQNYPVSDQTQSVKYLYKAL
ncbi:hypothetical protein [uncultured Chryseobacterium sp.]|uniref:hypothetical protein n=1 Tax=uncultured Chryseobacterium sp. TaxID=259322 RepID=UPI0025FB0CD1|nr:hypothetical protein [uncultured Chryseobacterium sp.]